MPVFLYRALTVTGQNVSGEVEAADRQAAIQNLQNGGLIPIEARAQARATRRSHTAKSGRGLPEATLTRLTRSLAMMLQAGESLERSLTVIRSDSQERRLDRLLSLLLERIRAGRSLSQAMIEQEGVFPRSYLSLVRAAEAAGSLGTTLEQIAIARERNEALKRKLTSSLTYPILLLVSAILAITVLLIYVVPQFTGLFSGRADELPALTRAVMAVSSFLTQYGIALLIVIGVAILAIPRFLKIGALRRNFEALLLAIPGLGGLLRERTTAEFSSSLAMLLQGGLDLPHALQLTREGLSLELASDALRAVESDIRHGVRFADSLRQQKILPPTALSLLETGEASGRLKEISQHLASLYEERLASRLTQMVAVVEPVLVIVLGLVVGAIVMSILSAVLSLNDLAI